MNDRHKPFNFTRTCIFVAGVMAGCTLFSGSAIAAERGFTTRWSKANDLAGFETREGKPVWVAEGGNPGGFLKTVKRLEGMTEGTSHG